MISFETIRLLSCFISLIVLCMMSGSFGSNIFKGVPMNKKVIYCGPFDTHGGYKGGIHVVSNLFFENYTNSRSSYDVNVVSFNTVATKRRKEKVGKINFQNIRNFCLVKKELIKLVSILSPKCVYYNTSYGFPLLKDLLIVNSVKKRKVPVVVHIHFAELDKILPKFLRNLTLSLLKKMDRIVFLSERTQNEFITYGIKKEKTAVLYNFHDVECSLEEKQQKSNRKRDILKLLFIGSIDDRKGIFDLLTALKNVNRPFVLNVCGEFGDSRAKQRFDSLRATLVGKEIIYYGYVSGEEKRRIMLDSDILVLPSYGEGLPLVVLEGLATGCAILSSNVGANPEIVKNENGKLINPGDILALTNYIQNVDDEQLNNYALHKFVNGVVSILDEVIYESDS